MPEDPQRPHIVMLFSDQHRADCLGHAGHPLVQTPNMDRLAAEGMRFTHADTPSPVCAPARQSLVTGQWPHNHTGICLYNLSEARSSMAEDAPMFPRLLRDAGYRTGFIGKWHCSPTIGPADAGYTDVADPKGHAQYLAEKGIELPKGGGQPVPPTPPQTVPLDAEDAGPVWSTRTGLQMLEAMIADGSPAMLSIHLHEPHPPYTLAEPWASMYDPADIPPWDNFADDLAGKPYVQKQMLANWGIEGWTWDDWRPHVAASLGAVSCVDHCLGMIMAELERLGISDNTLLIYSTDHGDLLGAHGMYDKHNVLYEEITHVPLLARWPQHIAAGSSSADCVSNCLDLGPTFLEVAGVPVPEQMDGRSLMPQFAGTSEADRDAGYSAYHGGQFGLNSQRSIRFNGWKYIFNATAEDELYDLAKDPGEVTNLAAVPAYRDRLHDLRAKLYEHFRAQGDPLFRWKWMQQAMERNAIV